MCIRDRCWGHQGGFEIFFGPFSEFSRNAFWALVTKYFKIQNTLENKKSPFCNYLSQVWPQNWSMKSPPASRAQKLFFEYFRLLSKWHCCSVCINSYAYMQAYMHAFICNFFSYICHLDPKGEFRWKKSSNIWILIPIQDCKEAGKINPPPATPTDFKRLHS